MSELERLGRDVQAELGHPPERWQRAQKERLLSHVALRPRVPYALVAAALGALLLVGAVALLRVGLRTPTASMGAASEPRQTQLRDGSSLTLTRDGHVVVDDQPGSTRVDLQRGAVELEVAPQGTRRFVVVAGPVEVTVVGTRFRVTREPSGVVEVAVTHGVVSVRESGRAEPTLVGAGEHFRSRGPQPRDEPPRATTSAAAPAPASASATPAVPDAIATWESAYRERRYAVAVSRAKAQGVDGLLASLPAKKLAELADAARLGGDAELALRALSSIERRFPGSAQAADASFLSGRILASRGDSAGALVRFEKYIGLGEQTPYAAEAMGRLVELYSSRGQTERARGMAQRYLKRAPDGPYRKLCESLLEHP